MNVENNHTAETEGEQTKNGSETITIQTTLGDEGMFSSIPKDPNILSNIVFGPSKLPHHEMLLVASWC